MITIEELSMGMISVVIVLTIAGFIGYGLNVYKSLSLDFKEPYKAEIVRIGGIIVPFVGAIGGYVDVGN